MKCGKSFWLPWFLCFLTVSVLCVGCRAQSAPGVGKISDGISFEETFGGPAESETMTVLPAPEGTIMGVYAWNEDLLIYYYADGYYMLCRVDSATGETLGQTEPSFVRELQIEFCQDNVTLLSEFAGHEGQNEIKIQDGIFNSEPEAETRPSLLRIFDLESGKFLWMDENFNIVSEYFVDGDYVSAPRMDLNNKYLYYVNYSGRILQKDRETGEEKRIDPGADFYEPPYIEGIYNNGTLLAVTGTILEKTDNGLDNFRSVKNYVDLSGGNIYESSSFSPVTGSGSMYYTTLYGMLDQAVFGDFSQPDMTWQFLFDDYEEYDHVFAWPQERRLCTSYTEETSDGKAREVLSLYDMDSGRKVACWPVDIEDDEAVNAVWPVFADYRADTGQVVFYLSSRPDEIYVWNTLNEDTICGEGKSYRVPYIPADTYEPQLFAQLEDYAAGLEQRFGVEILLGDDCPVQLSGYQAEISNSVPKIYRSLKFMEECLSKYPDGFFEQLQDGCGGKLEFYLVKRLIPDGDDSLSSTVGLYGGRNGQYIAISIDSPGRLQTLIYHEISHAIDYMISGDGDQNYTSALWNLMNPPGFSYAWGYRENAMDTSWDYIFNGPGSPKEAWFVDIYSKSFPTEDRARIMEYAMGMYPGCAYFESPHIRQKLTVMSETIRRSFDTEGWPETLWWERPLNCSE